MDPGKEKGHSGKTEEIGIKMLRLVANFLILVLMLLLHKMFPPEEGRAHGNSIIFVTLL